MPTNANIKAYLGEKGETVSEGDDLTEFEVAAFRYHLAQDGYSASIRQVGRAFPQVFREETQILLGGNPSGGEDPGNDTPTVVYTVSQVNGTSGIYETRCDVDPAPGIMSIDMTFRMSNGLELLRCTVSNDDETAMRVTDFDGSGTMTHSATTLPTASAPFLSDLGDGWYRYIAAFNTTAISNASVILRLTDAALSEGLEGSSDNYVEFAEFRVINMDPEPDVDILSTLVGATVSYDEAASSPMLTIE